MWQLRPAATVQQALPCSHRFLHPPSLRAYLCCEGEPAVQRGRRAGGAQPAGSHIVCGPGQVGGHAAQEVGGQRAAPHQRRQRALLLWRRGRALLLQPQVPQVEY